MIIIGSIKHMKNLENDIFAEIKDNFIQIHVII